MFRILGAGVNLPQEFASMRPYSYIWVSAAIPVQDPYKNGFYQYMFFVHMDAIRAFPIKLPLANTFETGRRRFYEPTGSC